MTVQYLLTKLDRVYPNAFDLAEKLDWINEIEGLVCTELNKTYSYAEATLPAGETVLQLPEGILFEDVECVFVGDRQIPKTDFRSADILGIGRELFLPATAVPVRIVYIVKHRPLVLLDETFPTLTFTADSVTFPESCSIEPGDTLRISDCSAGVNNREITVLNVEGGTVTVAENTFTPYEGSARVQRIFNQSLRAAPPYDKLYLEYMQAKIDQYNRDFDAYQNNMIIFNTTWMAYARYLKQRAPRSPRAVFRNYW